MIIKRREPKVKPSIRLILFRHGLHGFHGSIRLKQFKNCKDDFRCGISGKCIFQIFIFGEVFEINGWSAIVEVEKKVRSIIIDAKIGKLVQNRCVENRALACL